ncbi:IS1634 family transposase [Pleurocapsa sp. PCC 7319]|uniref:IS1634 family transposase n=1 Tax=Pleurocapsa sp. PCC 7319 TaxID=118161 RepID=UPI00034B20FE|nr:IS1634 family transposase [Pleurocapsa sp. PCC 7319]
MDIQVKNLDHLGIVAGIVDQIGLVEEIDKQIEQHPQQIISTGQVVKAMILNGLGFVSAPLYLFSEFFVGKATEHLLGEGIKPEHLNDDRIGRALDSLSNQGLTTLFTSIAMLAHQRFNLLTKSLHLDSSSFSLEGSYEIETADESTESTESIESVKITYGYSKDHRPDLKQFMMDVICTGDGDVPLFVRIGNGNESDRAVFAQLIEQFKQEWNLDSIYVADSALYSSANIQQLGELNWITLVPRSIKTAKILAESIEGEVLVESKIPGYRIASCCCDYGGVHQRWLIIESEKRLNSDLKQLEKRLTKQLKIATSELKSLMRQDFACAADAKKAAEKLSRNWKYHSLELIDIETDAHYTKAGRPRKNQSPEHFTYRIEAQVVPVDEVIEIARRQAGRFVLATNVLDEKILTNDEILTEYKGQQSSERGFRFLKDPLFFTSSVFLNTPRRVAALAMVMGLCLLVYTLGQRQLRQVLAHSEQTIPNQLKKPTSTPTLRWVFQCFQAVHLVHLNHQIQVSNLTDTRLKILRFFGNPCQKYYLIC